MSALVALYIALWSAVGPSVHVHELDAPVQFVDLYGNQREAPGATGCSPARGADLWFGPSADLEIVVHELAHAYDCLDDGVLNGSPIERPAERPAWVSDYCWTSDVEWYACWAVNSGQITDEPLPVVAAGAELSIGGPAANVISLIESVPAGESPVAPSLASLEGEDSAAPQGDDSEESVEAPGPEDAPASPAAAEEKPAVPAPPVFAPSEQGAPTTVSVVRESPTAVADSMPALDAPMQATAAQERATICQNAPRWQLEWLSALGFEPGLASRFADFCEASD